ncbi:MAG: DUF1343 domain-containing protein, partial [Desulfatibacillaceae bacterium]|nr:DUF1343 domain-containing protein [Desulfatibacillaceae bacterium]
MLPTPDVAKVRTGLEVFLDNPPPDLAKAGLGLLCNPASTDANLRHAARLINDRLPGRLKALFSPQHGLFAARQDNMVESGHTIHPQLGIKAWSLYGETRKPYRQMYKDIDVLLVDLADVGTRVYTFAYTVSYCMETAAKTKTKVVILDRPNPVGGAVVEGGLLEPSFTSFVGRFPMPMRHGLTMGELALLFNRYFGINCELAVISMEGWEREMLFPKTGLPWIPPSPNLPSPASALVYPGQVIWEGTSVSEGRGTTLPFEVFGAPWLDPYQVMEALGGQKIPGAYLRVCAFEPTSNKWIGRLCRGFMLHVTDADIFRPFEASIRLLDVIYRLYPKHFEWKKPPYEYEYEKMPIDLILGTDKVRLALESGQSLEPFYKQWEDEAKDFASMSASCRI